MNKKIIMLLLALCSSFSLLPAQVINTQGTSTPLLHYWNNGTCAGRVNEGLRAGWIEQLKLSKEHCGFHYLRMHGLFCDDMFVYFEKPDGRVVYNWQYIDEVYDRMLDLGVRPFVELSFFPTGIAAKNSKTQMWYRNNVSADRNNFGKWHDLVKAFVQHEVDRYGLEEVRQWYFEVWNEPNLTGTGGFFHGTKSDYFELYKLSANAVKSVDSQLKVGGPATSNFIADHRHDGEILNHSQSVFYAQNEINQQQWKGVWIEDFLKYCAREKLPVDFISTHPYPTDYALDPETGKSKDAIRYIHSLNDDIRWLRSTLAKSSYPDAEIHLTEWSTSPNSRDVLHDVLPPAAFIMKGCLDNLELVNSLMYWTFTDVFEEKGGGETPFHGGFGMINFQGLVKPSFHAYRMLNQLGDQKLYYADPLLVSRFFQTGKIAAVAFNYPKEFEAAVPSARNFKNYMEASSKQLSLTLTHLQPGTVFEIETLDYQHGNVYESYKEIGAPQHPTREEIALLKARAWDTQKETVIVNQQGELTVNRELQPWTCVLIREI